MVYASDEAEQGVPVPVGAGQLAGLSMDAWKYYDLIGEPLAIGFLEQLGLQKGPGTDTVATSVVAPGSGAAFRCRSRNAPPSGSGATPRATRAAFAEGRKGSRWRVLRHPLRL